MIGYFDKPFTFLGEAVRQNVLGIIIIARLYSLLVSRVPDCDRKHLLLKRENSLRQTKRFYVF